MITYQSFLVGKRLFSREFKQSKTSDHEHCNMCGAKFSENSNDLHYGFSTEDQIGWVCPECFEYYKNEYKWTIVE